VAAKVAAYEAKFGNRTIKIYAKATATALSAVSLAFNGYTNGSDPDAAYTLTWTSNSDEILIEFAGHIAVGIDGLDAGIGYGSGKGAASISRRSLSHPPRSAGQRIAGQPGQPAQGRRHPPGVPGLQHLGPFQPCLSGLIEHPYGFLHRDLLEPLDDVVHQRQRHHRRIHHGQLGHCAGG